MPSVSIEKYRRPEAVPAGLMEAVHSLFEQVRQRAYGLFEHRGSVDGWEMEDWLRAERELVWSPSEMVETEKEFQVRVAAPGFEAKDIQVTATPEWVMVQGETSRKREQQEGAVRFSEFRGRRLYRRLELPVAIDVEATTARLEKGILEIRAVKAGKETKPKTARKKKAAGA